MLPASIAYSSGKVLRHPSPLQPRGSWRPFHVCTDRPSLFQHISHPSIVSYLHSFSTPSHHCLVLEHISGGELLDLVDNPASHARLDEPLVRRIWGELCRAVAWMHSVGLVHRDIKLESECMRAPRLNVRAHHLIQTSFSRPTHLHNHYPHSRSSSSRTSACHASSTHHNLC